MASDSKLPAQEAFALNHAVFEKIEGYPIPASVLESANITIQTIMLR
jgi:hypothetical protein